MALRLILGDDPVLVGEAVTASVDELVGDGDRSLMLEIVTEAEYLTDDGRHEAARLIDAAQTPPFLTDKRVVVGRHLSRFSKKDDYTPLVALLGDWIETTDLVLVWEKGLVDPVPKKMPALPKALKEAVELAGGTILQTSVPRGRGAADWLRDQLSSSTLDFDRGAVSAISDLVGEDHSRVVGLVRTLEGALGEAAAVTAEHIATYGGAEVGGTVPWALEDAIDKGDVAGALELLRRLIPYDGTPTDRSGAAFRLMTMLSKRYGQMLRLDGAGVAGEKDAAELLGMKAFPAKKVMQQSRRLGTERLARAVELLADADLQLRGTVEWPPELVMEVLVARLANLSGRR